MYSSTHKDNKCRINHSTFYNIVKALTSSGCEVVKYIDYVQAILAAEPMETLQHIIDLCFSSFNQKGVTVTVSYYKCNLPENSIPKTCTSKRG